jgi:hypothetical protein
MSCKNQCVKYEIVAWARINDKGDLYDLRTQRNPYVDPKTVIPLYRIVGGGCQNGINTK